MTDEYDVIVIGAGISGLTAAYNLKKRSNDALSILVLEAKDRVGGRTHTVPLKCSKQGDETAMWDAGGQWVTDTQRNVTRLLKELDLETYRQFDKGKKVLETNGKQNIYNSSIPKISLLSLLDLYRIILKLNRKVKKINTLDPFLNAELASHFDKYTVEQVIDKHTSNEIARELSKSAFSSIMGLPLSEVNALYCLMMIKACGGSVEAISLSDEGCAQEKRVKNGTQQISHRLLERVLSNSERNKIAFKRAVVEVDQTTSADGCTLVKTVDSESKQDERVFKAKLKVITSIPLSQYSAVAFKPELPENKRHVFQACKMGNYIKFIVTYERAFWREMGFSGEAVSDGSVVVNRECGATVGPITTLFDGTTHANKPALVGLISATAGAQWSEQSFEVRRDEVVQSLVRFFDGSREAEDYVEYYDRVWLKEPYSGGCPAVCVVKSGVMSEFGQATREPFLNVHFCGSESALEWQGYMDGAIESGERAANEILYSLSVHNKLLSKETLNIDYVNTYYTQKELRDKIARKQKRNANIVKLVLYTSIPVLLLAVAVNGFRIRNLVYN